MSLHVYWLSCSMCKMFNAFHWNCFNLVDTCNIALILFLKCDVIKFRIPHPLSHNVTLRRPPPPPLTCDVIYGCPLITILHPSSTSDDPRNRTCPSLTKNGLKPFVFQDYIRLSAIMSYNGHRNLLTENGI